MPSFLDAPVNGAYHLVSWIATTIEPLTGLYAAAVAIVICTIAVRLLLLPLSLAAIRGERSRAVLMPEIRKINERHGKDPNGSSVRSPNCSPSPARPCWQDACRCSPRFRSSG